MATLRIHTISILIALGWAALPAAAEGVHVHLPRQVQIEGSLVQLGQISVVRCDSALNEELNDLKLGQIFSPQQDFVVDRAMITSRLVSQGIDPEAISFTGAQRVTIQRRSQALSGAALTQQARTFLLERLPYLSQCVLEPTRQLDELNIGQVTGNLRIEPVLLSDPQSKQLRVRLILNDGLTEVAKQDIVFRVRYRTGHLVATAPIAKGQTLTAENVKIEEALSNCPEDVVTEIPYGKIVTVAVDPNSIIRPQWLQDSRPPVMLERNSHVVIAVDLPGLRITAMGTTLSQGRSGELVKVRNNDSRRVILCKVKTDGSVEPVL